MRATGSGPVTHCSCSCPGAVSDERRPETEAAATERADLAAVVERHAVGLDPARPDAVERRRKTGQRTARENIADLCDPDSFVEFAPLAIAAQRRRREVDDLIARTPADGLVGGIGRIDGRPVVVASYDYTVLAGTQGFQNHRKKDRLFELAERQRLPVVLFAEGGGGRPGRHRRPRRVRPGHDGLPPLRPPQRHGAAGRDHLRSLLRRQRRPARLL